MDSNDSTPTTSDDGTSAGSNTAYRAVILAVALMGGVAVVFGLAGAFAAFTGGLDGDEEFDVLGEFECESFDGDPEVVHDADYAVERQVLTPTEVASFDGTVSGESVEVSLETEGPLLGASANEVDGRPIDVQTSDDTVVVERNTTEPFRLWVDSVDEDGTVTRMQLDICPA